MDTSDEIPVEDHRYFQARLDHLETQNAAALLNHLENGTLTEHLRDVAGRAMQAVSDSVINKGLPEDQADELVMHQIVADPQERSRLDDQASRTKMQLLLNQYKSLLLKLPRTYQGQSETTE